MSPKSLDNIFERVSFKSKFLIALGTIALVILLFYFLIYHRQTNEVARLSQEAKDLDRQIVVLQESSNKSKAVEERIKVLEEEIKVVATVLPDQKEIPELLKNISSTGRMSGLDFLLFKPGDEVKLEHVVEIPIQIEVQGSFLDTATFFYRIARLSRIVNIDNFSVDKPLVRDGGIILTTNLMAKTFRLLSEAEKKELEEKKKEEAKADKKKK